MLERNQFIHFVNDAGVATSLATISRRLNASDWLATITQDQHARVSLRFVTWKQYGERRYFIAISMRISEATAAIQKETYAKIVDKIIDLLEEASKTWSQEMQDIFRFIPEYILDVNGKTIDL